jgi:hypothetical protein
MIRSLETLKSKELQKTVHLETYVGKRYGSDAPLLCLDGKPEKPGDGRDVSRCGIVSDEMTFPSVA